VRKFSLIKIDFFSANFLRNNQRRLTNAFCLPAACSIQMILSYLNQQFLNPNDLVALGGQCRTNETLPFETIDIVAM
jgi:hypothetical protein